jgi:25S rRNA (uracil2634-N3)-methyltransferase
VQCNVRKLNLPKITRPNSCSIIPAMGHKSLKAALQSQQSRLKLKQKAAHAAQVAEQKEKAKLKGKSKGKGNAAPLQQTVPFVSTDKILLIGEGNFSFARALFSNSPPELEHLPPSNVTATAYDSEDECFAKYSDGEAIVKELRERGVEVLFGVDARQLERVNALKGRKWDRIVWNFPHAGEHYQFLRKLTDQTAFIKAKALQTRIEIY